MYARWNRIPTRGDSAAADYFASGADEMQALTISCGNLDVELSNVDGFLEFGCGYGGLTRHLVRQPRPRQVTGADLLPGAIEFEKATFGVNAFRSRKTPDKLDIPGNYDVIFAASLFSQLPDAAWGRWLRKLFGALAMGACWYSARKREGALPAGCTLPEDGILH
jgi:cyclopropane fatty-acyl-phospholipid synthase-like methyltransferase